MLFYALDAENRKNNKYGNILSSKGWVAREREEGTFVVENFKKTTPLPLLCGIPLGDIVDFFGNPSKPKKPLISRLISNQGSWGDLHNLT